MNTPSVTTSIRVRFDTRLVSRTRKPIVSPTFSPSVAAIRAAAARAARRRGSMQDEALAFRPWLVEERKRDARGLARARRGDEHGARARANAVRSAGSASSIGSGWTRSVIAGGPSSGALGPSATDPSPND